MTLTLGYGRTGSQPHDHGALRDKAMLAGGLYGGALAFSADSLIRNGGELGINLKHAPHVRSLPAAIIGAAAGVALCATAINSNVASPSRAEKVVQGGSLGMILAGGVGAAIGVQFAKEGYAAAAGLPPIVRARVAGAGLAGGMLPLMLLGGGFASMYAAVQEVRQPHPS